MRDRTVIWRGRGGWRAEAVRLLPGEDGLRAEGTQLGAEAGDGAWRADYELEADDGWRTRRLTVSVVLAGRAGAQPRTLVLERAADGSWTRDGEPAPDLDGADDVDLAFSPLTNLLPVRRAALHERAGELDLTAAFVQLPSLEVVPSAQRYEHVAPGRVRYIDLGLYAGFTALLELDEDGVVTVYPMLAEQA